MVRNEVEQGIGDCFFVRLRLLRFFVVNSVFFATSITAALPHTQQAPPAPTRIVSLIPAVTEMLFAIGAGPQVAAVSSFDRYPPEVSKLQRRRRFTRPGRRTHPLSAPGSRRRLREPV